VAVVTGGNQGLGLALVRELSRRFADNGVIYLTARNRERGEAAVAQLRSEGLSAAFGLLDVSSDASVDAFAKHIGDKHGGVDIVLSNAAARISPERENRDQVREFIEVNNHGTYRMITAFRPLLNDGARLIIVASAIGTMHNIAPHLRSRFDVATASLEDIEKVMDGYVDAVETGRAAAEGWPEWINPASKIAQVASVKVAVRLMGETAARRDILINAACPGLLDTEASRPWFPDMSSALTPDEGAIDVINLATLPAGTRQPQGELVQHGQVLPFGA
jgi:NAD(P)-dependent dehydrogenase (short-subunit alcohol dehydrogenase family)